FVTGRLVETNGSWSAQFRDRSSVQRTGGALAREAAPARRFLGILECDVGCASVRAELLQVSIECVWWDRVPRDRVAASVKAAAAALLDGEDDGVRRKRASGVLSRAREARFEPLKVGDVAIERDVEIPARQRDADCGRGDGRSRAGSSCRA